MQEHQTQELISLAHQQTSLAHQQTSSLQAGLVYNSLLPSTQAEVPTINHVTLNQSAHGQYAILTDEPEQYEQPLSDGVCIRNGPNRQQEFFYEQPLIYEQAFFSGQPRQIEIS
ncbi:hypothetical protein BGX34_000241 [Mortierella sp. NVP85]|nr:hypothetical protein BGX34_000241 [Mortierella sp. NVP85]